MMLKSQKQKKDLLEEWRIELQAFRMQSGRSTTELYPRIDLVVVILSKIYKYIITCYIQIFTATSNYHHLDLCTQDYHNILCVMCSLARLGSYHRVYTDLHGTASS
jgi:hypothetical protein